MLEVLKVTTSCKLCIRQAQHSLKKARPVQRIRNKKNVGIGYKRCTRLRPVGEKVRTLNLHVRDDGSNPVQPFSQ